MKRQMQFRYRGNVVHSLRVIVFSIGVIALFGFHCPAFAKDVYVYILDGGPPSSPSIGQLFNNAQAAYSGIPGLIIRIYNSDGSRRDNSGSTLEEDIEDQPIDSDTYVFAWSYGVENVNEFLDAGVTIKLLYTVDGTTESGPVQLLLGDNADTVFNYISSDPLLHGVPAFFCNPTTEFYSFTSPWWFHPLYLNYLENTFHILESFLNATEVDAVLQPISNQPGPVGDSGDGGTESYPLWAYHAMSQPVTPAIQPLALAPVTSLYELLPLSGPNGESSSNTTPPIVGITTATAAAGSNYTDTNTNTRVAGIMIAETSTNLYEHDYLVCRRVHGYQINEISPFIYQGESWWVISATNTTTGASEIAIPFVVTVCGTNASVDSQYLVDLYGPKTFDTAYNFQIWAVSLPEAMELLNSVLQQVSQHFNLQYVNTETNAYPPVIVTTAAYVAPDIRVNVINRTTNALDVTFAGPVWTQPEFASESIYSNTVTLQAGEQVIDLPVGSLHDAVIYVEPGGGLSDKFYLASGYWFSFDDTSAGGTSSVSFQQLPLANPLISDTAFWFANPPAVNVEGQVTSSLSYSYVGVGYSLDPNNNPVDISAATGVGFWVQGDGAQYRVKVESASVLDGDYHGYTFVAPTNWTLIEVPFSSFQQEGWGVPVALDLTRVQVISFVTTERPYNPTWSVDRLALLGVSVPPLAISGDGTNATLVWPNSASTFTLESASTVNSLLTGSTVSLRPAISGLNYILQYPMTNSAQFFRLLRD